MRRLTTGVFLLLLSFGLAAAGLEQINLSPEVPEPPVRTGTDGEIYYLSPSPEAGSYELSGSYYRACLWNTDEISEPYFVEEISWFGYLYYVQEFDFYIAPVVDNEPGTATFVGTSYDSNNTHSDWHTHVLDIPYPVLPGRNYYFIVKPHLPYFAAFWWCSNVDVRNPHASMISTDLTNWTPDSQYGGHEYLAGIMVEGEVGSWFITYNSMLINDEAVNKCGVPIGATIINNTGAPVSKNLYITTDPPSQYIPIGQYVFEPGYNTWYGCIPLNTIEVSSGIYDLLIEVGETPDTPDATDDFSITLLDAGVH